MKYRCETAKMLPTIIELLKKGDELIITSNVPYELETDRILPFFHEVIVGKNVKVYTQFESSGRCYEVTVKEIAIILEAKRKMDAQDEERRKAVYAQASKIKRKE